MPLEAIFGWVKGHVLGGRAFDMIADLRVAVEHAFRQRICHAKKRRDAAWSRLSQNSMSVL